MTESQYTKNGLLIMRRSKLELHLDILRVLAQHGPLKLTHVMYKANVNCSILKQYLSFLIQHNLVEEQTLQKRRHKTRVVYAITERGRAVLKYFREINTALQIIEEAHKVPALLY
jgi:predicted transcriptional regulator